MHFNTNIKNQVMKVNIQSIDFKASEDLIVYAQKKVDRLFRYLDTIISCDINLKVDNADNRENKVADIRLVIPGNDLIASHRAHSFEAAISFAAEALERQIEKYKTKTTY
jgi:ribosome hibernation promoting factor